MFVRGMSRTDLTGYFVVPVGAVTSDKPCDTPKPVLCSSLVGSCAR